MKTAVNREFDPAAVRVPERVASNFRYGRSDPGLLLRIEAEETGDSPGSLTGGDYVLFRANLSVSSGIEVIGRSRLR